jgi:hypothetical protein
MKNPINQEPDEASSGLFRKQQCREDTWEEVVRAQLKYDWLMQLNAMMSEPTCNSFHLTVHLT